MTISPGKASEAEELWKRVASHIKKQPGVEDCIVVMPLQGPILRIMISTRFSSLTAWDEFKKKMADDPESKALLKEQREKAYFVPGSVERFLFEVV